MIRENEQIIYNYLVMKKELIVLGSGTCVNGMGWEKKDRWPPAYILKGVSKDLVLLECSEGTRYRINQIGLEYTKVSDILITHVHPDHFDLIPFIQSLAVKSMWSEGKFCKNKIRIIGPEGIKKTFWNIWRLLVPECPDSIYGLVEIDFVEMSDNQSLNFYDSVLKTYSVYHASGRANCLAFRLEFNDGKIFAYSGDSGLCDGLTKAVNKATIFLCESSSNIGEDKSNYGHLNPFEVGELAKENEINCLNLVHFSGKNSPKEIIKECRRGGFVGKINVCFDKQTFII